PSVRAAGVRCPGRRSGSPARDQTTRRLSLLARSAALGDRAQTLGAAGGRYRDGADRDTDPVTVQSARPRPVREYPDHAAAGRVPLADTGPPRADGLWRGPLRPSVRRPAAGTALVHGLLASSPRRLGLGRAVVVVTAGVDADG